MVVCVLHVCVYVHVCVCDMYVFEGVHMTYLIQTVPMPVFLLSSTLAPLGTLEPQSFLFHNLLYISENWIFQIFKN